MAACMLAKRLERLSIDISVIESSDIPTVGVGEATVPAIRDFFRDLEIAETALLRATKGTIKLGIQFEGWRNRSHSFFHPFGLYGSPSRGVPFHQYWLRMREEADVGPLSDYSLCSKLALSDRFMPPLATPGADLAVFDWAVHFDAGLFAQFLKEHAANLGVRHIDSKILKVAVSDKGHIDSVSCSDGFDYAGDLFIDCTGFQGLLIHGALQSPYVDWTEHLPCDRAVAVQCGHQDAILSPYTTSTALEAGWKWRIPLQDRVGNGYVYCSRFLSDDEARERVLNCLESAATTEPKLIRFTTGHRQQFWKGNCIALGLAAGFLEPLESTSITLIQTGIEKIIELLPDLDFDPALAEEFNRVTTLEYERIRDFLILHYFGNRRVGEPFWDERRAADLPAHLSHKIRMFTSRGRFVRYEWEAFLDASWLSMYAGLDMLPAKHDPVADYFQTHELVSAFARMRTSIDASLQTAVPHERFVREHCS